MEILLLFPILAILFSPFILLVIISLIVGFKVRVKREQRPLVFLLITVILSLIMGFLQTFIIDYLTGLGSVLGNYPRLLHFSLQTYLGVSLVIGIPSFVLMYVGNFLRFLLKG